jgi:NAD(P)-dependent dehydrogenase (short-subunit alcohol dehydrogenase family)
MSGSDWLALDNTAVLIAGAGGIGTATALGYAHRGARVLLVDNDAGRLQSAVGKITAEVPNAEAHWLQADLTEPGCGDRVVSAAIERLGGLHIFLHAVGINDRRPILDFTFAEWDRIMRVNLNSAFELAQASGRHMVNQRHGRIIMLSSVSGLLAHAKHGPYAATKGGMNQLMRVMAHEWAAHGVTVNAIAPGYIETDLTAAYLAKPGVREGLVELVPAGRLGTPDEVVGPILFLSSEHASFVTGHVLYVDGGRTLV